MQTFLSFFVLQFPTLSAFLQCADNVLLIHAFNERLLVSNDDISSDISQNLATEGANFSRYYLVLFEKEMDSFTRFASPEIYYYNAIMQVISSFLKTCGIFRLRMWLISIAITDSEGWNMFCSV